MGEMKKNLRELERNLARRSYEDVDSEMGALDDTALIDLLDGKSIKVGDTAASLLNRRGRTDAVIDAVVGGRLSTKVGKTRAMYILHLAGKSCPRAIEVYLALIHDKNRDVVDGALFGLVFLQNERHIGTIREAMANCAAGTEIHDRCSLAIDALEQHDPFVFSPNFHDAGDVWGLNIERFASRIPDNPKRVDR